MLDTIFFRDDETDREKTFSTFLATLFFTILALLLSHLVIPFNVGGINFGSLMAVLITSLALSYPLTRYIQARDEEELLAKWNEYELLSRHFSEVGVYLSSFLAATLTFAAARFFLPSEFFQIQQLVLSNITSVTGQITASTAFQQIVANNISLLFATFALAFFITGGMVFVIIWNASVLGVLVGTLSRNLLDIPLQILPYAVHGFLEIAAYILAGLSGALLSYHFEHYFIHETHSEDTFRTVATDSLVMTVLGILTILIAAVIETGFPLA